VLSTRKLVLVVIDGLTPSVLEAVDARTTPSLRALLDRGALRRGTSTFPSLTPVCLSSIATGAHPDVHHIPHLVWYRRGANRIVEYGSSFSAVRVAGTRQSLRDTIYEMNERDLSRDATTVFEAVEDAGLVPAAVNFTCYRGRTRHRPLRVPGVRRPAYGPRRFFFYSLFESDQTGAPLAVRNRAAGSVDEYAAAVGRWLVTRDGFDFLLLYLSDVDYLSHQTGPEAVQEALERSDRAVGGLIEAAGGLDELLERYAVVLCSDHGQTSVTRAVRLEERFADLELFVPGRRRRSEVVVTASNRAGMIYRLASCPEEPAELATRLDGVPGIEIVLRREGELAVARREGEELRFARRNGGFEQSGDEAILADCPDGLRRAWAALANPNAGDLIVSAAPGFEFVDLGGKSHLGGGSHGALAAGDSEVPLLTIGVEGTLGGITDIAPLVLGHLGV
jgi:hypothetical protein